MGLIFEDLPNELFLFIFKYLSIINVFRSFYRLNRRFSTLIRTIKPIHVDFSSHSLTKIEFISILNQLRPLNLTSIRLSTRYYVDIIPFFISYIPPTQLRHLRSLTLIDVDRTIIEKFLHPELKLTSLTIESSVWRSIPRHTLPHYSHLTYCHLPTLNFLNHCHLHLIHLILDHCSTDNFIQLNTLVPNLRSLTLTLTINTTIPLSVNFPIKLKSLKLILRSILFTEFERLITMIDHLESLSVSFTNTEHEVYYFDQYLSGNHWQSIQNLVDNLQLNILVHRAFETYLISDLLSNFNWYTKKLICQTIDDSYGYHLFSLPFIDQYFRINCSNDEQIIINSTDFNSVRQLHLTVPNHKTFHLSSNYIFRNLQTLTIVTSVMTNTTMIFLDYLLIHSPIRTLEFRFTSTINDCQDFFNQLLIRLPSSIETLILNSICTKFLSNFLDINPQFLFNLQRLLCSVKNREQFDTLILFCCENFHEKKLNYLNIYFETLNKSSIVLSNWLLKTNFLKKARIKCSDRQCSIWI